MVIVQYAYILAVAANKLPPPGILPYRRLSCMASGKGGKPVGSSRDCGLGQGDECTRAAPCTPCSDGTCQACSAAFTGSCGFITGVGPYCRDARGIIGPCTKCCS
jgi:hypothetical protein